MKKFTLSEIISKTPVGSRLTVLGFAPSRLNKENKKDTYLFCKCSCGTKKEVKLTAFTGGSTLSCGCLHRDSMIPVWEKLRVSKYPQKLKMCYYNMMYRCYIPSANGYSYYGGRGVIVCDEWKNNPEIFMEWALKNGWAAGLQLDKDINGNGLLYSPKTCCFVTSFDNNNNKRNVKKYKYNGEYLTISQIAKRVQIPAKLIRERLRKGFSFKRAVTEPHRYFKN